MLNHNETRLLPFIAEFTSLIQNKEFVVDKTRVKTVEILGAKICQLDPFQLELNFFDIRKTPLEYCRQELEWYLSQSRSVEKIEKHASMWTKVCDKDKKINSNYGFLIFSQENGLQFENVYCELITNPESRRATMIYNRPSIWSEYNRNGMSDFICTMDVHYFVRDKKLISIVKMRSNDFIYGFFNDFFWQSWVHAHLFYKLKDSGMKLTGNEMIWIADSFHVYEKHFDMIQKIYDNSKETNN